MLGFRVRLAAAVAWQFNDSEAFVQFNFLNCKENEQRKRKRKRT